MRPMKILAVSDAPAMALADSFDPERWRRENVELLVACGDLAVDYLEFLSDAFPVPLYYIRGNHDDKWIESPPGENIDGKLVTYKGVRFFGAEGAPSYNGGPIQYGERSMAWKLAAAGPKIWLAGGVDVVVAHAAPKFCPTAYQTCPRPVGVGRTCRYGQLDAAGNPKACQDADDRPHRGFDAFAEFIRKHRPRYFLHGHRHQTYGLGKRELVLGETRVIDTYGYVLLDV